jgi:hypothetical protein
MMIEINFRRIVIILLIVGLVIYITTQILEEFTLQDDPILPELKSKIAPLFSKDIKYTGILEVINKRDVLNEVSLYKGNKSYTINKEKIFLCLKDKNNEYYDTNMLIYVLLHELAHSLCDEVGHTKKFNDIFNALLKEAVKKNIYDDKKPIIQNYCQ